MHDIGRMYKDLQKILKQGKKSNQYYYFKYHTNLLSISVNDMLLKLYWKTHTINSSQYASADEQYSDFPKQKHFVHPLGLLSSKLYEPGWQASQARPWTLDLQKQLASSCTFGEKELMIKESQNKKKCIYMPVSLYLYIFITNRFTYHLVSIKKYIICFPLFSYCNQLLY